MSPINKKNYNTKKQSMTVRKVISLNMNMELCLKINVRVNKSKVLFPYVDAGFVETVNFIFVVPCIFFYFINDFLPFLCIISIRTFSIPYATT